MATFQDTGKCKGFAFIDFKDEEGATTALKSKLTKMLINRKLRMEYGEDRSKEDQKEPTILVIIVIIIMIAIKRIIELLTTNLNLIP